MLRNATEMEGFAVGATDGEIGHVKDFYLDDEKWVIRYLVVDAGHWLSSRKVLVSPMALGTPDWDHKLLPVSISREQVKNSPDIDTEKPVSRQHEKEYSAYYAYPYYWGGAGYWGGGMYPSPTMSGYEGIASAYGSSGESREKIKEIEAAERAQEDPHLRSCNALTGYHIHARDGDIGHVAGMLIDDQTWAVRYLIVDTSNWWMGHQVLIAPQWFESVNWFDQTVTVSMTRQAIKDAPVYDPQVTVSRESEHSLYSHYGHDGYWADPLVRDEEINRI